MVKSKAQIAQKTGVQMSARATTYEVRVLVLSGETRYTVYNKYGKAELVRDGIVKMFHVDASKPEQAAEKAKRYGMPLSCRKADVAKIKGNIENLHLEPVDSVYSKGMPYDSALAMDELIWKKRNNRRVNIVKDKNKVELGLDK